MNDISNDDRAGHSPEGHVPLVWVEAEQIFVARGHIYRITGRYEQDRDSESVLHRLGPEEVLVISSYGPTEILVDPPQSWAGIETCDGFEIGARIGETMVVRQHGGNEYTVVAFDGQPDR